MYGRVTFLEGSAEQIDAGIEHVRNEVIPAARQLEGFRGVLNLTDKASGKGLTITFWETEEAMRTSEEKANRMREEAAQALGATIAGVERYEVTINEVPATTTV